MELFDDAVLVTYVIGWLVATSMVPVGKRFNHTGLKVVMSCDAMLLVQDTLTHNVVNGTIDAGFLAFVIWLWWNDGGGGHFRRWLKRLKSHLQSWSPLPQTA